MYEDQQHVNSKTTLNTYINSCLHGKADVRFQPSSPFEVKHLSSTSFSRSSFLCPTSPSPFLTTHLPTLPLASSSFFSSCPLSLSPVPLTSYSPCLQFLVPPWPSRCQHYLLRRELWLLLSQNLESEISLNMRGEELHRGSDVQNLAISASERYTVSSQSISHVFWSAPSQHSAIAYPSLPFLTSPPPFSTTHILLPASTPHFSFRDSNIFSRKVFPFFPFLFAIIIKEPSLLWNYERISLPFTTLPLYLLRKYIQV